MTTVYPSKRKLLDTCNPGALRNKGASIMVHRNGHENQEAIRISDDDMESEGQYVEVDGVEELHANHCPCDACAIAHARAIARWYDPKAEQEALERLESLRQTFRHDMTAQMEEATTWFEGRKEELETAYIAVVDDREHKQEKPTTSNPAKEPDIITELLGEGLKAYEVPIDGSHDANTPTALLRRSDGQSLLYDGRLNWIFGTPGSAKSWVALHCMGECLLRGQRVLFWDFEDSVNTLMTRANLLGIDLATAWQDGLFKYIRPGLENDALGMIEALQWATTQDDGPCFVVLDSAETSGCPSDGASVVDWIAKFVKPFEEVGATMVIVDHVAKNKEGRGLGPIGSQHKLARVTGSALLIDGVPWTQKSDGYLVLTNHKDRPGALPAPKNKPVARLVGVHEGATLALSFSPPEQQDNIEESFAPTLKAIADAGPDGVTGKKTMRTLVTGTTSKRDTVIAELIAQGYINKGRVGKKDHYSLTQDAKDYLEYYDGE